MAPERAILLAADHAGNALKRELAAHLRDLGWEPIDLGPETDESTDYPDWAGRLAEALRAGRAGRGVLCCGSGTGMAMAANRYTGIRAANCLDDEMAALARGHNDANVLCLGARRLSGSEAQRILWTFLETPFDGGRHARRVEKIEGGSG